ncbi:hypothetical protein MMC14_009095 [Varicellaria rhodocarpa]|nr:hypothetical protein [Varicellaria rhodocarpa]
MSRAPLQRLVQREIAYNQTLETQNPMRWQPSAVETSQEPAEGYLIAFLKELEPHGDSCQKNHHTVKKNMVRIRRVYGRMGF